jgi:hypothetical protein
MELSKIIFRLHSHRPNRNSHFFISEHLSYLIFPATFRWCTLKNYTTVKGLTDISYVRREFNFIYNSGRGACSYEKLLVSHPKEIQRVTSVSKQVVRKIYGPKSR